MTDEELPGRIPYSDSLVLVGILLAMVGALVLLESMLRGSVGILGIVGLAIVGGFVASMTATTMEDMRADDAEIARE